jgi:hypothetical protein
MMEDEMRWVQGFCSNVKKDHMVERAYACAEGTVVNRIMGVVQSHHVGLVRAGVRIKIMERTELRVKWSTDDERCVPLGQRVVVTIPAEAVRLEAGIFHRSKQRLNRWIGRIVLVHADKPDLLITVKVCGETLTLQSRGCVVGADRLSRTWDTVNIVIDPEQVRLCFSSPEVIGMGSGQPARRVRVGGPLSV